MKKTVFTLMLLTVVSLLSAQTLQFELDGHVYANGEVIICDVAPNDFGEMVQEMQIRNLSNTPASVIVTKQHIQIVEGTENTFCWGNCFSPTVFVSPDPVILEGNSVSEHGLLSFHYQVDPTYSGDPTACLVGTTIVKYTAYPMEDTHDVISIEVWFAYDATEVAENTVSLSSAYPNPASSQVNFDYKANNDEIQVVVYNLLGQEVKSQLVSGTQGKISIAVDDFQPGIYFVTFQVNRDVVKTEKFIVKR